MWDAAKRFFARDRTVVGHAPETVTTDGHDAYPHAIRETLGPEVQHRTGRYMNNWMEQDHRGIKQRYYPNLTPPVERINSRAIIAHHGPRMTHYILSKVTVGASARKHRARG